MPVVLPRGGVLRGQAPADERRRPLALVCARQPCVSWRCDARPKQPHTNAASTGRGGRTSTLTLSDDQGGRILPNVALTRKESLIRPTEAVGVLTPSADTPRRPGYAICAWSGMGDAGTALSMAPGASTKV